MTRMRSGVRLPLRPRGLFGSGGGVRKGPWRPLRRPLAFRSRRAPVPSAKRRRPRAWPCGCNTCAACGNRRPGGCGHFLDGGTVVEEQAHGRVAQQAGECALMPARLAIGAKTRRRWLGSTVPTSEVNTRSWSRHSVPAGAFSADVGEVLAYQTVEVLGKPRRPVALCRLPSITRYSTS
jgi:hypothetical protein